MQTQQLIPKKTSSLPSPQPLSHLLFSENFVSQFTATSNKMKYYKIQFLPNLHVSIPNERSGQELSSHFFWWSGKHSKRYGSITVCKCLMSRLPWLAIKLQNSSVPFCLVRHLAFGSDENFHGPTPFSIYWIIGPKRLEDQSWSGRWDLSHRLPLGAALT